MSDVMQVAAPASPALDVVFVHGLDGDARKSWSGKHAGTFWPMWLAEDVPEAAVWSVGYAARPTGWLGRSMAILDRATSVMAGLQNQGVGDRPLVFITHSMGGLLVKQILLHAAEGRTGFRSFAQAAHGVVFLGTPNTGSDIAQIADAMGVLYRATPAVKDLKRNSPLLRDINDRYRDWVAESGIQNLVFFETRQTKGLWVVDPSSANPGIAGVKPIPVDANHKEICKPASRDAVVYGQVKRFIGKFVIPDPRLRGELPADLDPATDKAWRRSTVDVVRRTVAEGARHVVLHGLPRTGKTTIIAQSAVNVDVAATTVRGDETHVIPVHPLTRAESRELLVHELRRLDLDIDPDEVLRRLPAGPLSLPGAVCAYAAALRDVPVELLADELPQSVVAELAAVTDHVNAIPSADRMALARVALLKDIPLAITLRLVGRSAFSGPLPRLIARALVIQTRGAPDVPTVVSDALDHSTREVVAQELSVKLQAAELGTELAAVLANVAGTWRSLGVFDELPTNALALALNRGGHWPQYTAFTKVVIDELDARGDRSSAVAARCRLARKVAQQGDNVLAWSLLDDARTHAATSKSALAEVHSHRAFLAYLHDDLTYAIEELERADKLRQEDDDPNGVLISRKLRGNILLRSGQYERAAECFRAALAVDAPEAEGPRVEAQVSLAQCYLQLDRLDEASTDLDRIILTLQRRGIRSELARALHLASQVAESRELPARALEFARRAADTETQDPAMKATITRTLWRLERFDGRRRGQE